MTVIEEIDDADTKSSAGHDTIKDTLRVNSKYIIQEVKDWIPSVLVKQLTCTKYALLLCVVVAGADVNGTPPFTHKSSGLPYPNWPWKGRKLELQSL